MARKLIIVGNWKMNKTPAEAKKFMRELNTLYTKNKDKIKNVKFGIAAPSVDLPIVKEMKTSCSMIVSAQDVRSEASGAYTGDLSISMVKAAGANAVIIGHSERREYHGETDKEINSKIKVVFENKMQPIFCIGETLELREAKKWKSHITRQVKAGLKGLTEEQVSKLIIAYEPIWAIGTGVTASASQAEEACAHVRKVVEKTISPVAAKKVTIQYGGSVKPENVKELMSKENIDGALVGGASLEAKSFVKLLTLNK